MLTAHVAVFLFFKSYWFPARAGWREAPGMRKGSPPEWGGAGNARRGLCSPPEWGSAGEAGRGLIPSVRMNG